MRVCFHGTIKENIKSILEIGFNADTWFALHLEDAIAFGGEYVFSVKFPDDIPDNWQFHNLNPVPLNRIVELKKYKIRKITI